LETRNHWRIKGFKYVLKCLRLLLKTIFKIIVSFKIDQLVRWR